MNQAGAISPIRIAVAAMLAALGAFLALAVLQPAPADAQLPPICDQYPELPQCQLAVDVPPEPVDPVTDPAVTPAAAPTAAAAAPGELPFTGYPLTPLLLLLLVLLLAGLTIRGYLEARSRLRRRNAGPPSGV